MKNISHILSEGGFWRLSKSLVAHLGITKAFVLTDLIDKYEYYRTRGQLVEDRWFFYKREEMERRWQMSNNTQRTILNALVEEGLIFYQKRGPMPQKNYYSLNEDGVRELFEKLTEIQQYGQYEYSNGQDQQDN